MIYSECDNLRAQIDSFVEEQLDSNASLSDNDFVLAMREYETKLSFLINV